MRSSSTVNDKFYRFIKTWSRTPLPSKEILFDYAPIAADLLFADEGIVRYVTTLLTQNITAWAGFYSPVYAQEKPFLEKSDLVDKRKWYVKSLAKEAALMQTSGSTSDNGHSFAYLRWNCFLPQIEGDNHYDLILDEFEVSDNPVIADMLFRSGVYNRQICEIDSQNFMQHHGFRRHAKQIFVFSQTDLYYENQAKYYDLIIDFLIATNVDVLLASGPYINSLVSHIKRRGDQNKIAGLLSNTYQYMLKKDASFLKENGLIGNWCDHMRCWDGGAGFFTCRFGTVHLMDNLSWTIEIEKKLISTDYFSFPSPFVNYWNGDLCRIADIYRRCQCGRLFRPFLFLENRPFGIKGQSLADYKNKIKQLGIVGIKQVKCDRNHFEFVTSKELSLEERLAIEQVMTGYSIKYTVEL